MLTIDASHFPTSDDITLDSLDYLFAPAPVEPEAPVPWVEIIAESESDKRERKIRRLEKNLLQANTQMQKLCVFVGYMQGVMKEKDEALKALPDLRYKAALTVARELEVLRSREKIRELEEQVARLANQEKQKPEEILKTLIGSICTDELAISLLMWLGVTGLAGILYSLLTGL